MQWQQPKRNRRKVGDQSETLKWTHLNEKFYLVDGWLGFCRKKQLSQLWFWLHFLFFFLAQTIVCVRANLIKTNFHLQRVAHQAISQAQSKGTKKRRKKSGSKGVKTITRTSCKLTANTITNTQDQDGDQDEDEDGGEPCTPLNRKNESKGWRLQGLGGTEL